MALGDNIRERRTQLKMSQEYVAGQLGISRQAVAKWEAGKKRTFRRKSCRARRPL